MHRLGQTRTAAIILCILLSACSTLPTEKSLDLPVAEQFDNLVAQTGEDASHLDWQEYFADPVLQQLIQISLENNRDLQVLAARVEQAQAAYGIEHASKLPSLTGQLADTRVHLPAGIDPLGLPLQASGYSVGAGVASWELDFWGRVHHTEEAATETYLSAGETQRAAALALIGQVATEYIAFCETNERLVLAKKAQVSRSETLRIFTRRVEVGSSSRLQLTQVETLLAQAQSLVAELEQTSATQLQALTLLVGAPISLESENCRLRDLAQMPEIRAGLPSDLLSSRPDVIAAEHKLLAAHANIEAARAAFYPRISLTSAIGGTSVELGNLFDSSSKAWIFAPAIDLPIFDGGRRKNNLALNEARQKEALATYAKTIQGAFRDVNNALAARQWLSAQLVISGSALQAQIERSRLSILRFDAGASPFLEVLDAQRDLLTAEQQAVQAEGSLMLSKVALYSALGGGSLVDAVDTDDN